MATYFVDDSTGNDANDGLDNIGVALSGTVIWTESTFTITEAAGHGYTFAAGDLIYVDAGTGVTVGLYEVASSTSTTIVLVETSTLPTVGNASDFAAGDLATGDITSSDGPWLTIQQAMDTVSAGDRSWIRSSGTYGEQVSAITAASSGSPIIISGYTTSVGDNGVATNDGTDTLAVGLNPGSYYVIENMRFTQFTSNGIGAAAESADNMVLIRVRSDNNGGHGVLLDNNHLFYGCYFHNNVSDGVQMDTTGTFINCIFEANGTDGVEMENGYVINCLFVSNGLIAINFLLAGIHIVSNTTIDGDTEDTTVGISFAPSFETRIICVNNLVYDCGTGISASAASNLGKVSFNNLLNGNSTDYSNFGTDLGEVTGAPEFINEGVDYTLGGGSPAKNAGADLSILPWGLTVTGQQAPIGAISHVGGGGGGLLMANKRGGKQ